jgi:hypothetical protein
VLRSLRGCFEDEAGLCRVERGDFWQLAIPLTGQLAAVGSPEEPGQERVFRASDDWGCRSQITDFMDPAGVGGFHADCPRPFRVTPERGHRAVEVIADERGWPVLCRSNTRLRADLRGYLRPGAGDGWVAGCC